MSLAQRYGQCLVSSVKMFYSDIGEGRMIGWEGVKLLCDYPLTDTPSKTLSDIPAESPRNIQDIYLTHIPRTAAPVSKQN